MSESQQIQLWGGSYANSGLIDPNHWLGGSPPNSFPHYYSNSYPSTHKLGGVLILGWLKYYPIIITVTSHAITVISCYQILWYGLRLSLIRSYKCPGPPPQWLHLVCALRSQPQVLFPQLLHALQHLAVARQGHFQPKNGWTSNLGILQVCGTLRTCTLRRRFNFLGGGAVLLTHGCPISAMGLRQTCTSWVPNLSWNIIIWLVVELYPSEKWWSSSVGMMTFPIYGKIKAMFQTTNQLSISTLKQLS